MQNKTQAKNGNNGLLKEPENLDLHPSTKKRIKEHLSEIEYVLWQIELLVTKAEEREKVKRKGVKIKKLLHSKKIMLPQ